MKRILVLTSVNDSDEYISGIEGANRCWNSLSTSEMSFHFRVIHANKGHDLKLDNDSLDLVEFEVPTDVDSVFASQMLRLLCADQNGYDGVLITDVDILPVDPWYFIDAITSADSSKFLVFRNVIAREQQYPICYLYASPVIWRLILGEEIPINRLQQHWMKAKRANYSALRGTKGWTYDQRWIFSRLNSNLSMKRLLHFPYPNDENFLRLDRIHMSSMFSWIVIPFRRYSDYHRKLPIGPLGKYTAMFISKRISFQLRARHD
jgi:hypothetical protein